MWDFEHGNTGHEFDVSYTLPSACARALEAGTADIGIIPAAAYAQMPGLMALPGVAIASRRPVRSILLVSRVPVDQIHSVALDTSSMTSVALTKILFEKWLGGGRTFTSTAPNIEKMLAEHDAALVIGDPRTSDQPLALFHARSCRGMDSPHRQTLRLRLLGSSSASFAGKCIMRGQPPSAVRVAKRRSCAPARPGHDLSTIPRPRTRSRKPRPHRPRMGSKTRHRRSRRALLPYREHLLLPRLRLSRRTAPFLSLRG